MLKSAIKESSIKKGSTKSKHVGPLESGLTRRAFLKTSTAISLLATLPSCKPNHSTFEEATKTEQIKKTVSKKNAIKKIFDTHEKETLKSVQMILFPDDGDGPSADDINAIDYLEWAMTDEKNIDDEDDVFIKQGIKWLDDLSQQTQGDNFLKLTEKQKNKVITQIAKSNAGENWLALLIYYLTEALLLDPIYGGNTEQTGWQWLEHQAGFPRPIAGKTYRDFE